ncbi:hypothetical protein AaE_014775 [Aphanomyces astaci]|uniref:Uncharacterized protein n=1 Tax=Aphanomyces astaci TaxID=112090 RepID=A0A6A4ZC54_APHAT|nr:hypothetical protein AaE_014775 [Aphanomyces astaci]
MIVAVADDVKFRSHNVRTQMDGESRMIDEAPSTSESKEVMLRVLCVESRHAYVCSRSYAAIKITLTRRFDPASMSSLLSAGCTVRTYQPTTHILPSSKDDNFIAIHFGLCLVFVALAISMVTIIVVDYWHNDMKAAWFAFGAFSFVMLLLSSVVLLLVDEVNVYSATRNCSAIATTIQEFSPDVVVGALPYPRHSMCTTNARQAGCAYGGDLVLKIITQPTYEWVGPSVVVQPTAMTPELELAIKQFPGV